MSEYPGHPRYVVVAMPKSGTKTMNKVFRQLGFKVFDIFELCDHAELVSRVFFSRNSSLLIIILFQIMHFSHYRGATDLVE